MDTTLLLALSVLSGISAGILAWQNIRVFSENRHPNEIRKYIEVILLQGLMQEPNQDVRKKVWQEIGSRGLIAKKDYANLAVYILDPSPSLVSFIHPEVTPASTLTAQLELDPAKPN